MLVLKLRRVGRKRQPSYRLVVSERRSKLNGKRVDDLGWYNPRSKERRFNKERVLYWLGKGAQKTDTVHNLLVRTGVIVGKKIAVNKKHKVDQASSSSDKKGMNELINQIPVGEPTEGQPAEQPVESQPAAPAEQPAEAPVEPVPEVPAVEPAAPDVSEAPASAEEPAVPGEEKRW